MSKIINCTAENVYVETAKIICKSLNEILKHKEVVVLGLPGGRSIVKILSVLKKSKLNWYNIHIFMVDERIVPPTHKKNNFRLIRQELSETVPSKNLHPFPFNPDNVKRSIELYTSQLDLYGGKYDVVYLSAGEDGHIASLFPEHNSIENDSEKLIHVKNSPKPPLNRMSISKNLLLKAKIGVLLFSGKEKKCAFQNYLNPDLNYRNCPAKLIDNLPKSYVVSEFGK